MFIIANANSTSASRYTLTVDWLRIGSSVEGAYEADSKKVLGEGKMGRAAKLCSVAVLMTLTLATPAYAQSPTREFMPLPDRIELPNVCPDFTIVADILVNREYGITFTDANGDPIRTITQGSLVVRLTNPENGESIVRNISGPGEIVFRADGSNTQTAHGAWFLFFFEGQLGTGMTGTGFVNHGQVVFVNNADGTATILSQTGNFEDVCVTLG